MDLLLKAFVTVLVLCLFAFTEMADAQKVTVDKNAANASNNPLTPKDTFYLQNFFMPSVVGQGSRSSDQVLSRLYAPFSLGGIQNSLRIYAPFDTVPIAPQGKSGTDFGLGDMMVFDLILNQIGTLQYGAGPLAVLPTSSHANMGSKTWQAGPAAIAVKRWDWGLIGATVTYSHSFAGGGPSVQAFGVEPLLFYNLPNAFYLRSTGIWSLGFRTEPSYIPIGFGIGKLFTLPGGATLNLHVEPQYSVYVRGTRAPRWQLLTGLIIQFGAERRINF